MFKELNKRMAAFLALVVILVISPCFENDVLANISEQTIEYIDKNGEINAQVNIIELEDSTEDITLTEGWYYAKGTVEYVSKLLIDGDVKIVLCDNARLSIEDSVIFLVPQSKLTIYGQNENTGALYVEGYGGIISEEDVSVEIVINGGDVELGNINGAFGKNGGGDVILEVNNGSANVSDIIAGGSIYGTGGSVVVKVTKGSLYAKNIIGGDGYNSGGDVTVEVVSGSADMRYILGGWITYGEGGSITVKVSGGSINIDSVQSGDSQNGKGSNTKIEIEEAVIYIHGSINSVHGGVVDFIADNSIVFVDTSNDMFDNQHMDFILFKGDNGTVYGDCVIPDGFTIAEEQILMIPDGAILILSEGKTLINNGMIIVEEGGMLIVDADATIKGNGVTEGTISFNIVFKLNGGICTSGSLSQVVSGGDSAIAPQVERGGYTFAGWDKEFTNITKSITVTAKWDKNISSDSSGSGSSHVVVKKSSLNIEKITIKSEKDGTFQDVIVILNLNGNNLKNIKIEGKILKKDIDYIVDDGERITILGVYLRTLKEGINSLVFDMNQGDDLLLELTIIQDVQMIFEDVTLIDWFYEDVKFVIKKDLFRGMSKNSFAPNAPMTRAMFITVLARHNGCNIEGGEIWYEKALQWSVGEGLTDGSNPNENITREQIGAILWRYEGSEKTDEELVFTDTENISNWATEAIAWAVEEGFVGGYPDGSFNPQGNATRAEVAAVFKRFIKNY